VLNPGPSRESPPPQPHAVGRRFLRLALAPWPFPAMVLEDMSLKRHRGQDVSGVKKMEVSIHLPDDLVPYVLAQGDDVPCHVLESLALAW